MSMTNNTNKIWPIIVFIFLVVVFSFVGENTYFSKTVNQTRIIFWPRVFLVSIVLTLFLVLLSFMFFQKQQRELGFVYDKEDGSRVYSLTKQKKEN